MAPFFSIWAGQAVSLFGSSLVQFALVWWLTQSTGSATVLATATLAAILPQILLAPFAGALVDRWNRRRVMMVADSLIALVSLGLASLYFAGLIQIWHIYLVMLIRSAGGAFHYPAMLASTSLMVPKEHLARIAGLNQTLNGGMNIISPPVGALLLGVLPMQSILLIDVITAAIAVSILFFIPIPQPPRTTTAPAADGKHSSVFQDMGAGLRYVAGWPGLMIIMGMATLLNFLFNPAFSLLPLLVTRHFKGDAIQLGLIDSLFGIGVVIGGLVLGAWGGFKRRILTSMTGLVGMGLGVLLMGLAPSNLFSLAVVGFTLSGFANSITNGPLFAVIQSTVAQDMQGRVMSLINAAASAMSPLSLLVAGPIADAIGIQAWYIAAGLLSVAMALVSFAVPAVMHIEDKEGAPAVLDPALQGSAGPD